jgi:chemotaxis protein CheD
MVFAESPTVVTTVLGSCLSVTMWHPRWKVGAICHGLLPRCNSLTTCSFPCGDRFRYVNCSLLQMIRSFEHKGIPLQGIEVKMFGGADMFPLSGTGDRKLRVGEENAGTAINILQSRSLPIVSQDVGGTRGRKILFHVGTGEVLLKRLGPDTNPNLNRDLLPDPDGSVILFKRN